MTGTEPTGRSPALPALVSCTRNRTERASRAAGAGAGPLLRTVRRVAVPIRTTRGPFTRPLLPEAAAPRGVGPDGPQEVHLAEVRPIGLAEVELRVRALPEQEAGQPLLAGGPDDQVGVRLALGI